MKHTLADEWGEPRPSDWAAAVDDARKRGFPIHDLITASPLENGFAYPQTQLAEILARAAVALRGYHPDARGQLTAREAIAEYHGTRADRVIVTPGTSLSYYYAFRLLANPGDEVLCPAPTYPLFDDLATMAGVRVRRYHLHGDAGGAHWSVDADELEFQVTPRTRAIVIVSPHNPTGSVMSETELQCVVAVAKKHGLAIVFDEVFRENVYGGLKVARPSEFGAPLCVTLNGLSKMLSLPGLKAGWMVAEGEDRRCERFLNACEYMSDTLLPVSEVTQAAIPELMASVADAGKDMAARYADRMREFVGAWKAAGFEVRIPEGSPYLCIPMKDCRPGADERIAQALAREGILVHAGSSYGFAEPCLVMTCVGGPPWPLERVREAVEGERSGK